MPFTVSPNFIVEALVEHLGVVHHELLDLLVLASTNLLVDAPESMVSDTSNASVVVDASLPSQTLVSDSGGQLSIELRLVLVCLMLKIADASSDNILSSPNTLINIMRTEVLADLTPGTVD